MRRRAAVQIAATSLSGNSLRQTVHTRRASVQAAKLVAALLRVARVTAGLAKSNGSLPPGLRLTSPAGWLPRTGMNSRTLCSVIKYGLALPFLDWVPGGRQPSDQASWLGLWVLRKLAATIHVHHRHCYYYSAPKLILILPSYRGWKAESAWTLQ